MNIVERKISELIPSEYNPRKLSPKERKNLRASLLKYGLVDPIIINMNPERMNIIIGGHQRCDQWKAIGNTTVPCVELNLSINDEKELNLRLNKNTGSFDYDLVSKMFDTDLLLDIGFNTSDLTDVLSDFDKEFAAISNTPKYEIVPKFNESYDSVMIFCKTEMDFNWLRNVLQLTQKKDYKTERVKQCHVITVEQFQKIWEKK